MKKVNPSSSDKNLKNTLLTVLSIFMLGLSFLFMVNGLGIQFALCLLFIFAAKEIGFVQALRKKDLSYFPSYMLPFPYPFGSLCTFQSIRSIAQNPKLDAHVQTQGIFYAFIASLILMVLGLNASESAAITEHGYNFSWGQNLLSLFLHYVLNLELQSGSIINYHPMYLAGLAGSFTCALSLLPIGQLNGGYLARQALGKKYVWLSGFCCAILCVLGFTHHYVWLMIVSMFLLFTYGHDTENHEMKELSVIEHIKIFFCFLIFISCFMPTPYVFSI